MCDQQRLSPACAYAQYDQSLCQSLEYYISVQLLTDYHLEFLSFTGGCACLSDSTLVKMPHCWKSRVVSRLECVRIQIQLFVLHTLQLGLCTIKVVVHTTRFVIWSNQFMCKFILPSEILVRCVHTLICYVITQVVQRVKRGIVQHRMSWKTLTIQCQEELQILLRRGRCKEY